MTRTAVLSPALSKEIRALLPFWGASVAALAAALIWRQADLVDEALLAYVVGSLAIGAQTVGQEYTYRTLPMLLSQPADRRRMYLLKFRVAAVMLVTLGALAAAVVADVWRPERWPATIVILAVLCGLFLAPLLTMICRSSLAGVILSASALALMWFGTVAIAWFWFGIDIEAAERTILLPWTVGMIVVCSLVSFVGWRRFAQLEATESASRALHLPRWLTGAAGARRYSPLRALAAKEIHLQQLTFGVVGVYIIVWGIFLLAQRYIPSWSTFPMGAVMLLYCTGLAIVIGALASGEERQHGTLEWQLLQPAPAWQQWMVKVGVALGLALLFGVGLPLLMIQFTPHDSLRATPMSADLMVLIVLLTASSMYISSLSSSGVRAMVLSLPVGMAVMYFVRMVSGALRWATLLVAGPLMADIVTGAIAPSSPVAAEVVGFLGRGLALTLVPLLLWFGLVNHTSSDRTARRILQQAAAIALLIITGVLLIGGVLAFYELRSR